MSGIHHLDFSTMRRELSLGLFLLLHATISLAEIAVESPTVETLEQPTDDWFVNRTADGAYLFDSATGNMLGLLSLTEYTPAIAVSHSRGEVYAAESYWSRLYRGTREDVLTVYDMSTLSPIAEIDIPDKILEVRGDTNIALMGNGTQLVVYNLTPAQSVSVVHVGNRQFQSEISTPGCAMIMPVGDESFLMVCGDGTLQLIRLAENGTDATRVRSRSFFSVQDDAVFDRPARTRDGWLLISHAGQAYGVSVEGDEISVSEPWSLLSDAEQADRWRPGGAGLLSVHQSSNLAFVLMHQGGVDTHHDSGSELWIFDLARQQRVMRRALDQPSSDILVLQGERPRFIAATDNGELQIYDALQQRYERTITEPGPGTWLLQGY